jgi:hypothetical protein
MGHKLSAKDLKGLQAKVYHQERIKLLKQQLMSADASTRTRLLRELSSCRNCLSKIGG